MCWAVTYTGAPWLLGEMNSVYRTSRPQRNGPTFSASRLPMQTDPHEEWVMCGAGRSHGHRRCLCDLSWPCRKRVNRLDGKAWHLWDFETFQSSAWELFQVGIFTPALQGCTSSVPLWSASSSSQMFEYQKVPSLWQVRPRVRGCITAQQYTSPSTEGLVVWKALFLLFH